MSGNLGVVFWGDYQKKDVLYTIKKMFRLAKVNKFL